MPSSSRSCAASTTCRPACSPATVRLLGVVFLETVAMGFVSKTVPQLNVLSLGFPVRIIVGFVVIIAAIEVIALVQEGFTFEVLDLIHAYATGRIGTSGGVD